jgi:DedD protein
MGRQDGWAPRIVHRCLFRSPLPRTLLSCRTPVPNALLVNHAKRFKDKFMPLMSTRSKTTSSKSDGLADAPLPSNEELRRKAKVRLIGSAVLVLIGVLAFTLMLDTQPRPNAADIAVLIPSRDKVPPLSSTPYPTASGQGSSVGLPQSTIAPTASLAPQEEIVQAKPAASMAVGPAKQPDPAVENVDKTAKVSKAAGPGKAGAPATTASVAKASANPSIPGAGSKGRYILQVGAFADALKAREARMKLERAGITTYTQVVESAEGRRIRVRVGPFDSRSEAEKAAAKAKALDLPAAILAL